MSFSEYFEFREASNANKLNKMLEQSLVSEIQSLKRELTAVRQEMARIQSVPLILGTFIELLQDNYAIIGSSTTGSQSVVRISSTVDRSKLVPGVTVALHRHSSAIVDVLKSDGDTQIRVIEKPKSIPNIGGLDSQKQELFEAVELPLTHPELFDSVGVSAPKGVLLYGPPGTGKTMLARAVAASTKASFISVNGSSFVQKYLGEGPKLVRDVFRVARANSPAIIFIDEVDAIASTRNDAGTSADREVQRVLIELLNQMDGFDKTDVRVIMATNRADTIDPALLRPGRLDRKIFFPNPDKRQRRLILAAITSKMAVHPDVDLEALVGKKEVISPAEIAAICQEAGMLAIRNGRYEVMNKDFEEAHAKIVANKQNPPSFYA